MRRELDILALFVVEKRTLWTVEQGFRTSCSYDVSNQSRLDVCRRFCDSYSAECLVVEPRFLRFFHIKKVTEISHCRVVVCRWWCALARC